jgi:urease accessory protein
VERRHADRARGRPVLHTTVGPGPGAPARLPPVAPRAYASTVHMGSEPAEVGTDEAWDELRRVMAAVEALSGPVAGDRMPA